MVKQQRDGFGCLKFSSADWLKFLATVVGAVIINGAMVMGMVMSWTNRVVAIEVRISNVEQTLRSDVAELRADIKELLKRTQDK